MTDNATLENVPPSLELVRISNHALKVLKRLKKIPGKIAANYSNEEPDKSCGMCGMMVQNQQNSSQAFSKFEIAGIFPSISYYCHSVVKTQSSIELKNSIIHLLSFQ